jgi:hypothetical protein
MRRPQCDATNLHHSSAVIRNGLLPIRVHQEKVPAIRPERALDGRLDGEACVDIGEYLAAALRLIRSCHASAMNGTANGMLPSFKTMIVGV